MRIPIIRLVEWLEGNEVRLFFSSGKVVEVELPIEDASDVHIIDDGGGLDLGDGTEMSSYRLAQVKGKIHQPGNRGWVGYIKQRVRK